MSTNKTQNYALHSWSPTDDFQLSEINQNFADLDTILSGKPEIVVGSYVGLGTADLHVELGRRPVAVHIEQDYGSRDPSRAYGGLATPGVGLNGYVTFDDTGFTLQANGRLNGQSCKYPYIAYFAE